MKHVLTLMTQDEHGSALYSIGTDEYRVAPQALEIFAKEGKPVFLKIATEMPEGQWEEKEVEVVNIAGEFQFSSLKEILKPVKTRYEVEVLEERVGHAQKVADALYLLFDVSVTDIIMGPNGNPSLLIEVPENWHWSRSFKLWLLEGPNLMSETEILLDPILAEVDETYAITDDQYELLREQ